MGKAARFILGAWVILIAHVFLMLLWVEGLQLPELNGGYVRVYIGVIIGSLVIGTPILAEAVKAQNLKRVFEKIFGETTPNTAPTVKREAHVDENTRRSFNTERLKRAVEQMTNVQKVTIVIALIAPFLLLPLLGNTSSFGGSRRYYDSYDYSILVGVWLGCALTYLLWAKRE